MSDPTPRASIMIVDDSPANLSLLGRLFRERGFTVRPFSKPPLALRAARNEAPDLFLLDINMPEMDGYELCCHLKKEELLKAVPVIFLSTLREQEDKLKAFESGGVDYVTKQPFHFEEILARVDTHLKIRELQRKLEQQNQQLRENYEKLKRLEEMKDSLTHMIVHDMRSPLTVVHMAIQMIQEDIAGDKEGNKQSLEMARRATDSLVEMTTMLLDINRLESGKMPLNAQPQELSVTITGCMESLELILVPFTTSFQKPEQACIASYDSALIIRVINNLLGNAAKFTPPGGTITVVIEQEDADFKVLINDSGPGLPVDEQRIVFEKFGQGKSGKRAMGIGLGLTFCKLAVEAHGGAIGVVSEPGQGASFWFTLPICRITELT